MANERISDLPPITASIATGSLFEVSTPTGGSPPYESQKATVAELAAFTVPLSTTDTTVTMSPVTGALVIQGGVGVLGSIYLGGSIGGTMGGSIGGSGVAFMSDISVIDGSLLQKKVVSAPTTGATVTMTADQRFQALAPSGTISTLTLVLPPSPLDNQAASVGSSQIVTTLTVSAGTGGATILGAPATLAASSGFTMIYQSSDNKWYRAG